jgi:hypothetical protein
VIEKGNGRVDATASIAFEVKGNLDAGLRRLAGPFCLPLHIPPSGGTFCSESSLPATLSGEILTGHSL